ncbi:MAG TPA: M1 family aminopeptidase [Longimicrobiales bacterium]|nr:M1 family aminopeptidase [Longimicrobiales bacterium]
MKRSFRPVLLGPLALVAAAAGCGPGSDAIPLGEGVSRELARHRSATLSDLRYDYRLGIPAERASPVTGQVVIRFRRTDPEGRPVVLDFKDPAARVRAVRVNGEEVEPAYREDHVVLPPGAFGPPEGPEGAGEEARVEIVFEAGDEALNRTDDFLYALFVPDRAHFSLPLFDQPDLKARVAFTLEVPAGWTATANGALEETVVAGSGPAAGADPAGAAGAGSPPRDGARTLYRFAESEPIPTYLFAFAAGEFEVERAERAGRSLTFHHREPDAAKVARNREAIFDLHGTALEWLEGYTAIPYPFGSFGFVAVPSFQYGGMEHPGAVYYRADGLFLEESATQRDFLGRASVIAHETAHMWFGDLVTMEWFDDVWMKEVFANFMAAKIVHPSFPEIDHDLRFVLSHHPSAYAVDRTPGANPIRQELANLREAGTLYGAIIYQKAPVVMRQLEILVGEETFRDGLREYLEAHAYGNASWPDLIEILDRRSPRDLAAWSRVWVEEPGRPEVSVEARGTADGTMGALRLVQADPRGRGRVWPQTLRVVLGWGTDSTAALPVRLLGAGAEVEGAEGLPLPDYVLPGGGGLGYGRMRLDPASLAFLTSRLVDLEDPMVRGTGWIALWDAVLEGEAEPGPFLDLAARGAGVEPVELVLQRSLDYLETAWWRLIPPEERAQRAPALEEALWSRLAGEGPRTVKASLFETYRSVALSREAVERLRRIRAGEEEVPGLPLAERDRTALARELALRGVEGWREILDEQEEAIENPDRRARFAFVRPSLSADPVEREAFFESLGSPGNREREPWVLEGLANLHHPLRAGHAEALIRPGLEMLPEIQRTGDIFFPGRWLDATLGGHGSPGAARTVRAFLDAHPDLPARLRGKVLQSADLLFRAARIVHGADVEPPGL